MFGLFFHLYSLSAGTRNKKLLVSKKFFGNKSPINTRGELT